MLRWERAWAPEGGSFFARDVATAGGMIAVAGRVSPTDLSGTSCDDVWTSGWIVRVWRPDGTGAWQRSQPGWRSCEVFGTAGAAVAVGPDTVAMAAACISEYAGSIELISFGSDGRLRWMRDVEVPGSKDERVGGIAIGGGGDLFVAASRNAIFLDSAERDQDAMLARYRADGTLAWRRTVPEGPLGVDDDHDAGTSVALLPDGVVLGAVMDEPSGPTVARIAKYGWRGTLLWERRFSGVFRSWGPVVEVGRSGAGVVVAGTDRDADGRGTHVALRGLDASGGTVWRVNVGPDDDLAWQMTGLATGGGRVVVGGRPASGDRWSRVWFLGT